ncbi:MAG: hypothetical protein HY810_04085 [Candidatus Omnitrophica bacterium]|nr:hypothetical protein [Candidatus Omnitrophota bacterium]
MHLSELTGLRAATLGRLLKFIKDVPGACIYHHTHRFLQQHQYLSPEPPNDFAYWVSEVLSEVELGERLASIDTVQYTTIRQLREKIVETIGAYLKDNKSAKRKFARREEEFHFIKSVSFVIPTNYFAYNLREFAQVLRQITIDSIYFHVFEARIRLEKANNDFSNWIEHSLGDKELADKFSRLDPYTQTLEGLRAALIRMAQDRIGD